MERFGKKVDPFVFYIMVPAFIVSVLPMFFGAEAFWILFFVNGLSWGLVFWLYTATDTMIDQSVLIHNVGPVQWEININDILELRMESKSGINHGTWSLDKMDVIYREGYKKTLSIAPLLKQELVNRLIELNPEIKIS